MKIFGMVIGILLVAVVVLGMIFGFSYGLAWLILKLFPTITLTIWQITGILFIIILIGRTIFKK